LFLWEHFLDLSVKPHDYLIQRKYYFKVDCYSYSLFKKQG
jgi:hypothetical protein